MGSEQESYQNRLTSDENRKITLKELMNSLNDMFDDED
jgi:hypothetical protein